MAIFECVGGISPTGNALPGDVKEGVTFSNENDVDIVGTFAAQQKTITSSRDSQIVVPDDGKYLSKVTVNGLSPSGTFTPTSRAANIDMGAKSNYRYVTTESVPNKNTGTYTYASGSTGGTVDLGETNTYRYVNAGNVYNAGHGAGYNTGYNDGRRSSPVSGNNIMIAGQSGSGITSANSASVSSTSGGGCFVDVRGYSSIAVSTGSTSNVAILKVSDNGAASSENSFQRTSHVFNVAGYSFVVLGIYSSNGTTMTVTRG